MRKTKLIDQPAEGIRSLDRIEILALQVLDQREFRGGSVINRSNDCRDALQPCELRSAPTPLARDDLILRATEAGRWRRPHDDGLHEAGCRDRCGQSPQRLFIKVLAGLIWIGPDFIN
jgi:hypothetical protein